MRESIFYVIQERSKILSKFKDDLFDDDPVSQAGIEKKPTKIHKSIIIRFVGCLVICWYYYLTSSIKKTHTFFSSNSKQKKGNCKIKIRKILFFPQADEFTMAGIPDIVVRKGNKIFLLSSGLIDHFWVDQGIFLTRMQANTVWCNQIGTFFVGMPSVIFLTFESRDFTSNIWKANMFWFL